MTLSELITEFRAQVAAHAAMVNDDNDDDALVAATYGPSLNALTENPPVARNRADMIAALGLVLENDTLDAMDAALVRSVLDGLREN